MKPRRRLRILVTLGAVLALTGCTAYGAPHGPRGPGPSVKIPPGHMPPPGECRIWFPDRPPGQQPPPGPCHHLKYEVPPGAYLVRG